MSNDFNDDDNFWGFENKKTVRKSKLNRCSIVKDELYNAPAVFGISKKGRPTVLIDNNTFIFYKPRKGGGDTWRCAKYHSEFQCRATAYTKLISNELRCLLFNPKHTHD